MLILMLFFLLAAVSIIHPSERGARPAYRDPGLSQSLVRGSIYDRNGNYLAIQAPDYGFSIHISDSSAAEIAHFIERYTDENAISVEEKAAGGETFIPVTIIPSPDEADAIRRDTEEAGLNDDITFTAVETRKYPLGSHAENIVGITDGTLSGISGIEKLFDSSLSPVPDTERIVASGNDITLSIDSSLQYAFTAMMERYGGCGALLFPDGSIAAFAGASDEEILKMIASKEDARTKIPGRTLSVGSYTLILPCGTDGEKIAAETMAMLRDNGFIS